MGEGTRIHFWHDRWISDTTLEDLYPELYVCSMVKDACISKVLWIPEGGTVRVWNLTFIELLKIGSWLHHILYFNSSKLVFLRVLGEIPFTGGLKGMVSLKLGLTTL